MKCEICECQEAAVHFKQVCNGQIKEMYVCEECAAENGFDLQSPLSMPDFLFGAGLKPEKQDQSSEKTCMVCGTTGKDFKKRSLLGCPSCYEAFAEELSPYLRAMQKGGRHVGKAPAGGGLFYGEKGMIGIDRGRFWSDPKELTDALLRQNALASSRLPLEKIDQCPEDLMNRILWHAMKGSAAPYPAWAITNVDDDD